MLTFDADVWAYIDVSFCCPLRVITPHFRNGSRQSAMMYLSQRKIGEYYVRTPRKLANLRIAPTNQKASSQGISTVLETAGIWVIVGCVLE